MNSILSCFYVQLYKLFFKAHFFTFPKLHLCYFLLNLHLLGFFQTSSGFVIQICLKQVKHLNYNMFAVAWRSSTYAVLWEFKYTSFGYYTAKRIPIVEPQKPSTDVSELHKTCRLTAPKSGNVRSSTTGQHISYVHEYVNQDILCFVDWFSRKENYGIS